MFRVCLVETLRPDLELEAFHLEEDVVGAAEELYVEVADGVVELLVVHPKQARHLWELFVHPMQHRQGLLL